MRNLSRNLYVCLILLIRKIVDYASMKLKWCLHDGFSSIFVLHENLSYIAFMVFSGPSKSELNFGHGRGDEVVRPLA